MVKIISSNAVYLILQRIEVNIIKTNYQQQALLNHWKGVKWRMNIVFDHILKSVCLENEVYGNISLNFIITQRFCISCARFMHLLAAACASECTKLCSF